MEAGPFGYTQDYLDRFLQGRDSSVVNRFQQRYWKTKQTLIKVTGKKEDEHVVASDADLDGKLEVFHSIQRTCMELLKVIEQYQRRICCKYSVEKQNNDPNAVCPLNISAAMLRSAVVACVHLTSHPVRCAVLSQEENELGRFLRSQGSQDRTRAGKIMQATGKALCFSSQQRLALRNPLCRLYQEVETFRYRAISDTWLTVNRMEQSRTEYRGALLWMKDVSQELDPDTHKQMEKFRKVQAQVRTTKTGFDKLKNDVCQKVDLLGASRCNLLSHVLTTYQTTLLHFWEKTSRTMAAIHESFKGCHQYEFSALTTLKGPADKLAKKKGKKKIRAAVEEGKTESPDEQLISLRNENTSSTTREGTGDLLPAFPPLEGEEKDSVALLNEILGGTSVEDSDFSREWAEVFGDTEDGRAAEAQRTESSFFLPSQLWEQSLSDRRSTLSDISSAALLPVTWATDPSPGANRDPSAGANQNPFKPAAKEKAATSKDLLAWFNLFADLDPLSNPDAVGKTDREHELHNA